MAPVGTGEVSQERERALVHRERSPAERSYRACSRESSPVERERSPAWLAAVAKGAILSLLGRVRGTSSEVRPMERRQAVDEAEQEIANGDGVEDEELAPSLEREIVRRRGLSFFAAVLLGGSLLFGGIFLWQREVQAWIPTEAEVVRMWSTSYVIPPHQSKYGPPGRPMSVTVPWIRYSYSVDGRRYSRDVPRSREGTYFTAYYDPDHPGWSRLDRPEPSAVVAIVAGLLFLGGILALWRARS